MQEREFRIEMANLGFYALHLMKGCVLANYKKYDENLETISESSLMFYVKEKEIQTHDDWIKGDLILPFEKIKKAFELIQEYYSNKE